MRKRFELCHSRFWHSTLAHVAFFSFFFAEMFDNEPVSCPQNCSTSVKSSEM